MIVVTRIVAEAWTVVFGTVMIMVIATVVDILVVVVIFFKSATRVLVVVPAKASVARHDGRLHALGASVLSTIT